MSKPVTIRVDDQLHALLKERAEAEGTTVTALISRAAHDAVRDPGSGPGRAHSGGCTASSMVQAVLVHHYASA
ncbi:MULTISPECIES: ribbon-helix-helix domain-containing protein [unclassified Streptomyces]|uniref:ribbon-helix-helix domain-containing protein n=1 Tax=Streptomyces sp. NPDC127532 TaxID=3345399 RepID=UPI0036357641